MIDNNKPSAGNLWVSSVGHHPHSSQYYNVSNSKQEMQHDWTETDFEHGQYVSYTLKYEGSFMVHDAHGIEAVRSAFRDLKILKTERHKKGNIRHAFVKEFQVSLKGVKIVDPHHLEKELFIPLSRISYIVNDDKKRNYVALIYHRQTFNHFECIILKHDEGKAKEIVETMGYVFELALKFLKTGKLTNGSAQSKPLTTEEENLILKERIANLAKLIPEGKIRQFLKDNNLKSLTDFSTCCSTNGDKEHLDCFHKNNQHEQPAIVACNVDDCLIDVFDTLDTPTSEYNTHSIANDARNNSNCTSQLAVNFSRSRMRSDTNPEMTIEHDVQIPKVKPPPRQKRNRPTSCHESQVVSLFFGDDPFNMMKFTDISINKPEDQNQTKSSDDGLSLPTFCKQSWNNFDPINTLNF